MIDPASASHDGVDRFLAALETRLRAEIDRTPVAAPARLLLNAGGKRLRARLLWWSACATAPVSPEPTSEPLVRAAAAIELAHLGSLVHDDIVDGGDTRRGVPTLHRSHGLRIATDAGAALAHLSNELVAPLGRQARRAVRRALLATCRGQIRELAVPFVPVSPRMRFAIMREKTGAFFELAAALGASVVAAPAPSRAAITRFARRFGIAFQIADDVLDLAGDPRELGRANGADLRDGVPTLPVLLAIEREPAVELALTRVRDMADTESISACADAVVRAGGVTDAADAAAWWLTRALQALEPLGTGDAIDALTALARTSIARGVQPGVPTFAATASHPRASHVTNPFVSHVRPPTNDGTRLHPRLTRLLDWFHPGIAGLVAMRMDDSSAHAHCSWTRDLLATARPSAETRMAADALALAHALSDADAIAADPVQTLALVDALHCAAIAFLNEATDPTEQSTVAARARDLRAQRPTARNAPSFPAQANPSSMALVSTA